MSSKGLKAKEGKKREGTLLFEQTYMAARVVQLPNGFDIEFAGLDANSIAVFEEDEIQAKAIFAGLDVAYRAAIADLQKTMLEALESVTTKAKEGASSDTPTQPEGDTGENQDT